MFISIKIFMFKAAMMSLFCELKIRGSSLKNDPAVILSLKHIFLPNELEFSIKYWYSYKIFLSHLQCHDTQNPIGSNVKLELQKQAFCYCPGA